MIKRIRNRVIEYSDATIRKVYRDEILYLMCKYEVVPSEETDRIIVKFDLYFVHFELYRRWLWNKYIGSVRVTDADLLKMRKIERDRLWGIV